MALYRNGQMDEAEERLLASHQLDEENTTFLVALARLLQQRQKFEEAIKYARKLIALDARHGEFLQELLQQQAAPAPRGPAPPSN